MSLLNASREVENTRIFFCIHMRTPRELSHGIARYVRCYNVRRPHASLGDATPEEVYCEKLRKAA